MIRLLGLSGGIASGKSLVAGFIRERGIPVLDADQIARKVVEPGHPAYFEIVTRWPKVIGINGQIDRKALGQIVFNDSVERVHLEAITHPRIREWAKNEALRLGKEGNHLTFLEAALLVETGFFRQLDGLVLVTAPKEVQLARLMAREGFSREEAKARLAAQWPLAEKTALADYLIDNGGSQAHTRQQVEALLQKLSVIGPMSPP
jgi:dephospho-CoA kinase